MSRLVVGGLSRECGVGNGQEAGGKRQEAGERKQLAVGSWREAGRRRQEAVDRMHEDFQTSIPHVRDSLSV